jgi:HlyD family secretion protein
MRIGRRWIIWGAVAIVAAVAAIGIVRPSPVDVDTAVVARQTLRVTIDEEGETRLRRRFTVSAPVGGRVLRIEARSGDRVSAGQVLARITPARPAPLDIRSRAGAEARVQTAEAALARAQAERRRLSVEAEQAGREAARTRTLFDGGSVAREAVELADVRARSAAEAVAAADAAIRTAEFSLAEARSVLMTDAGTTRAADVAVLSPIDGLVLRRLHESEAVIGAGAPLIEIGDLRDLEIVADLLSRDAVRVAAGSPVAIINWGGPHELAATVDRVEPAGFTKVSALGVEEQRVNVVVAFVDPPDRRASLGDGFRVEVRILLAERPNVLAVPTASLFRVDGRWAVFVVEDGRLTERAVQIGEQNEQLAEVLDGLAEGDRVVVYPGESLADGTQVVVR